jgi:replication factor C subunit 3/5
MEEKQKTIPWVEKYRPENFNNIVLEENNKIIFNNMIKFNSFPNLLLYGPPGTGKTTTIINIIKDYQIKYKQLNKGLIIHLNASDERGIDIIRNQISQFVNSQPLFSNGLKFVVLDEVDYMTKCAQQALKHLLQNYNKNVRFCLICNYISKIEESLQNELLHMRFNQLPSKDILTFLEKINRCEKLNIEYCKLENIQKIYQSDLRSMINYMQSNYININNNELIKNEIWENLFHKFKTKIIEDVEKYITLILTKYNLNINALIKNFINFILENKKTILTTEMLNTFEFISHSYNDNDDFIYDYLLSKLLILIGKSEKLPILDNNLAFQGLGGENLLGSK